MTDQVITHPDNIEPNVFTRDELGWVPRLQPLAEDELTDRHHAGLVDPSRAKSPYFMLLARDPDILGSRTKTDKDIFYNTKTGLPRAEREIAATAASRTNGCIFCASVHSRFAWQHSKRSEDVQKLLDEGIYTDIDPSWNAIIDASAAQTKTPHGLTESHIDELRRAGLDDVVIVDVINGAAFFNWANRLMLSIGEPTQPAAAA